MQVAELQQECTRLEQVVNDLERQLRTSRSMDSQAHSSSEEQQQLSTAHVTDSLEGMSSLVTCLYAHRTKGCGSVSVMQHPAAAILR